VSGAVRRIFYLAAVASLPLVLQSCADDASRGRPAEATARTPTRIISLIPSATEIILSLGAADRLIARTEFDHDPRLADLPSVGRGLSPSLEHLVSLDPDLVITWPDNASRSLNSRLAELGVTVYSPESQSLADIYEAIRRIGSLLALTNRADSLASNIRRRLAAVHDAVEGRERPAVLYIIWHEPPTVAGPGTYIDELISIAGGRNVFHDAPALWPQVSIEEVVRRDPDILVVPVSAENPLSPAVLREATGWREMRAVRQRDIASVDGDLFNRPGPRIVEAAELLARIFHPEALEEGSR